MSVSVISAQIEESVRRYSNIVHGWEWLLDTPLKDAILTHPLYLSELEGVLARRLEMFKNIIEVEVAFPATVELSRIPHTNSVLDALPAPSSVGKTKLFFFELEPDMGPEKIDLEYDIRGLEPADPHLVIAKNAMDPKFGKRNPNSTHWVCGRKRFYFSCFDGHGGEKYYECNLGQQKWFDKWWAAGVPKKKS